MYFYKSVIQPVLFLILIFFISACEFGKFSGYSNDSGGKVYGRVFVNGTPAPDITVFIYSNPEVRTETDENGFFEFYNKMSPGIKHLFFTDNANNALKLEITVVSGSKINLGNIHLEPASILEGIVSLKNRAVPFDVTVKLLNTVLVTSVNSSDGYYEIKGLTKGCYDLEIFGCGLEKHYITDVCITQIGQRVVKDLNLSKTKDWLINNDLCGDNFDNNCNGLIDEGFNELGDYCSAGIGRCLASGYYICSFDGLASVCNAVAKQPEIELCNDIIDNDCDGLTDEGYDNLNEVCTLGIGECNQSGVYICSQDKLSTVCNAVPLEPIDEICDNLDNDCDGTTDEEWPEKGQNCDTDDLDFCQNGVLRCSPDSLSLYCSYEVPSDILEICDDIDNNCDGRVNEDYVCGCSQNLDCLNEETCSELGYCTKNADYDTKIRVPAGYFNLGIPNGSECSKDEIIIKKVYITSFLISKYEITNFQYKKCVNTGNCEPPVLTGSETRENYYNNSEFNNYPVVNATWEMANNYCVLQNGSLPSEAQWEKAALGENSFTVYPFGGQRIGCSLSPCDICASGASCEFANYNSVLENNGLDNYCENGDTASVDSYPNGKSIYGIYNMAGNVSEWTIDWYTRLFYYTLNPQNSPHIDPVNQIDLTHTELKTIRGGSFMDDSQQIRSENRTSVSYNTFNNQIGFRCIWK